MSARRPPAVSDIFQNTGRPEVLRYPFQVHEGDYPSAVTGHAVAVVNTGQMHPGVKAGRDGLCAPAVERTAAVQVLVGAGVVGMRVIVAVVDTCYV